MTSAAGASPGEFHHHRKRIVWAGIVGNVMEWYDFAIYGFFARTIGSLFFPADDPELVAARCLCGIRRRLPYASVGRHSLRPYWRPRRPRPCLAMVGGGHGGADTHHRPPSNLYADRHLGIDPHASLPHDAGPGSGRRIYELRRLPCRDCRATSTRRRQRLGGRSARPAASSWARPSALSSSMSCRSIRSLPGAGAYPSSSACWWAVAGFIIRRRLPFDKPVGPQGLAAPPGVARASGRYAAGGGDQPGQRRRLLSDLRLSHHLAEARRRSRCTHGTADQLAQHGRS